MVEIKWEIDDEDLIKVLVKEYEFEAKNYIDAQLLMFFEKNKNKIEKAVKEYVNSNEFKEKLIKNVEGYINDLANEEVF